MQLTAISNLRKENIILNKAKEYKVKGSKFTCQSMKIETIHPNEKKGPLVSESPFL